jgi:hypothetical protein
MEATNCGSVIWLVNIGLALSTQTEGVYVGSPGVVVGELGTGVGVTVAGGAVGIGVGVGSGPGVVAGLYMGVDVGELVTDDSISAGSGVAT